MKRLSIQEAQRELELVVEDSAMQALYRRAYLLAEQSTNVLLLGDSGTGKDMLARFIHHVGPRKGQPFIQVNCSSIPGELFESELFGYAPGAFSGALPAGKKGLAQIADHGILFLDEIGELGLENQVKLLQFLQSGEIRPLGAKTVRKTDVQIISATNRDLSQQVEAKLFRQDLYYRICVVALMVPPLRERPRDTAAISQNTLRQYNEKYCLQKSLTNDAVQYLCEQEWSGNIRQLKNYIQRLCLLETPQEVDRRYLEKFLPVQNLLLESREQDSPKILPLPQAMAAFEKQYIQQALKQTDNLEQAAQMLGIPLSTLNRKKKVYQLYKYPRYND